MGLLISCSKGCGESIEVTDEMLDEAKKHNSPINISHEVCPTDPDAPQRKFRITTTVIEYVTIHLAYCNVCGITTEDGKHAPSDNKQSYEDWISNGNAAHEVDDTADREEIVSQIGETLEAGSFKSALPELQKALERQWGQVLGMADIVDQSPGNP